MINGHTELIAHIGYPTHAFKAPMIYNPYFEHIGVNACVVPMGCRSPDYPAFLRAVFTLDNIRGALITMPHKVATVGLLDRASPTVAVAGACNAVRRAADGTLERVRPALGAKLATLGYLFPALRRVTQPLLERRGRAAKARHRKHIPR